MRTLFLLFFAGNWLGWGAIGFAQSPTFAFRQASEAYQARDWAEAARQFSSLISNQPGGAESREAWFYLGEARTQLGESEAATAAYRNFLLLVGSHPHREKARFRLAEQAYLSGSADAVQQCEGFLQAYPRSVWQAEMLAYLGQLRLQRGEAQLAAEVLGTALKRFPEHPLADENRLGLASAQFKLGDGDSADKLLKDLEQRRNDGVGQRARLLLALRELEAGDRTAARKRLESVLASNAVDARQIAESRFWLARILVQEGDSATAATLYWQALESGLGIPQFTIAIREWTSLRLQMGEANEAASDLKKLQQASEAQNWTRSHRELVLALEVRLAFEAGQWDEAAQGAETYRVSFPTGHDYRQVTEIAGRAAYAQGKYESAAEMFAELLRTPDLEVRERATYQYQLACQQVASKQFAAALATLAELDARLLAAEGAWHAKRLEAVALEGEGRARESMECLRELSTRVAPGGDEAQRYLLRQALQLAIKLEQLDAVAAFWPGFRALGSLTSADLSLVQRVGDLAYRNRDWALATDCYRELARSDWGVETQAVGWAGLAWTAWAEQRPGAAREAFESLVGLPVSEERKAEAYLPLGTLLEDAGETSEAVAMYERAIDGANSEQVGAVARFKASLALQKIGTASALTKAHELLETLQHQPDSTITADQVAYRLAWLEEELGRDADAYQRFTVFLKQFPESPLLPDVVFRVAALELQRGEAEAAASRLELVRLADLPAELRERLVFLQGQVAASRKQWNEVIRTMEPLADTASEAGLQDKSAYWLAEARFQSGDYPRALTAFEQLLAKAQLQLASKHRAGAELRRLECLVALEDWSGALAASERSAAAEEGVATFQFERLLLRGRSLFALGKLGDAAACFEQVASGASGTELAAEAQWRIGETRLAQENHAEALSAYLEVSEGGAYPHWQAAALLQAGKCEERLGNRVAALRHYRDLLQRFPDSEFAVQAQRRADALGRRARNDELIRR